jgi:hypothetical protein
VLVKTNTALQAQVESSAMWTVHLDVAGAAELLGRTTTWFWVDLNGADWADEDLSW